LGHWSTTLRAMSLSHSRASARTSSSTCSTSRARSQALPRLGLRLPGSAPDLDAGTAIAVGIQTITLQHEGWERDKFVAEPAES
jgi:hypothetical protein